jgi:hypothetical protein
MGKLGGVYREGQDGQGLTVILTKHRRPPVGALDKLLPLGHDSLELRQLPLLEVVLVLLALPEVDNVELEHHAQLLVARADVLEHLVGVGRVRQLAHRHRVVLVEHLLVHLSEELVHPRAVGVVHPRGLFVEPGVGDGGVLELDALGVPEMGSRLGRWEDNNKKQR